jgi:hypothetical protein
MDDARSSLVAFSSFLFERGSFLLIKYYSDPAHWKKKTPKARDKTKKYKTFISLFIYSTSFTETQVMVGVRGLEPIGKKTKLQVMNLFL